MQDETHQEDPSDLEDISDMNEQSRGTEESHSDPIAALQIDIEKFRDLALRSQADLDNYRKRSAREKEEAIRYANASLIEDLLPVLDNFSLGLEAAKQSEGGEAIVLGLGMVQRQFEDFLSNHGITPVDAVGQPFDPNLHEALGQEPSDDVPEGQILRQARRGYRLRDRLIRPANVIVSSGPAD